MANILGWAVVIIILVAVVSIYGNQLMDLANSASIAVLQKQVNESIKTQPQVGQTVCTLTVGFHPALEGYLIPHPANVKIPSGADKIAWTSCNKNVVVYSLTPQLFSQYNLIGLSFTKLDLFQDIGKIPVDMKFNAVLVADDGTQLLPTINPVPAHVLGTITDQQFSLSFTFYKVPLQHYTLQLSSQDASINGNGFGSVYAQQVNP